MVLSEILWPPAKAVSLFEADTGRGLWQVEAFFDGLPEEEPLRDALALAGLEAEALTPEPLPEKDWVREGLRHLSAVRAGRFVVHGRHERDAARPGEIGLEVDAALAFGTGHHGTTRGCLLALDWLARRAERPRYVLDVGTGTGILAMAAARLWRVPVVATDIDPVAVAQARSNARRNGLAPWVRAVVADGLRHALIWNGPRGGASRGGGCVRRRGKGGREWRPACAILRAARLRRELSARTRGARRARPAARKVLPAGEASLRMTCGGGGGYDLVMANILLNPLRRLAPEIVSALAPGGYVVLSGLMADQEAAALAVYRAWGLMPVRRWCLQGWSTLLLRRPDGHGRAMSVRPGPGMASCRKGG
jgi:ribosomal protein L11 methylase PrmA